MEQNTRLCYQRASWSRALPSRGGGGQRTYINFFFYYLMHRYMLKNTLCTQKYMYTLCIYTHCIYSIYVHTPHIV